MSEQRTMSHALPGSFGAGSARNVRDDKRDGRRSALFRETPFEVCQRVALGSAWALRPKRLGNLVPLTRLWLEDALAGGRALADLAPASDTSELAGIARDLSVPTLLAAYRRGLFPHGHVGTPKWLSPAKRGVLLVSDFHISARLRSIMRQGKYDITFDRDFEGVIKACAGRRPGRWRLTWITPRIMRAYAALYDAGHVHSFEVWNRRGELVGGGYGVAVGRVFVIESQFFHESNASKIGFSVLVWHLAKWGFVMCDNKWLNPTMVRMGFHEMPRAEYLRRLAVLAKEKVPEGRWEAEAGSKAVADWRPRETH